MNWRSGVQYALLIAVLSVNASLSVQTPDAWDQWTDGWRVGRRSQQPQGSNRKAVIKNAVKSGGKVPLTYSRGCAV